jgi:hypothetical protein
VVPLDAHVYPNGLADVSIISTLQATGDLMTQLLAAGSMLHQAGKHPHSDRWIGSARTVDSQQHPETGGRTP